MPRRRIGAPEEQLTRRLSCGRSRRMNRRTWGYREPAAPTLRRCRRWSTGPLFRQNWTCCGFGRRRTRARVTIAAARRRLPMVEVDGATPLIGERGAVTLLDVFEGRRMLIAYYFMWHAGHPAPEQCEGCTWVTSQVRELSYIHSRDVTYATFCQGPYEESARYRDFMGWEMPWYSARDSLDTLLVGRRVGMMHIVCYLRQGSNVFETYWTTRRGVEALDNSYALLDLTVYGRQEMWEDSPTG